MESIEEKSAEFQLTRAVNLSSNLCSVCQKNLDGIFIACVECAYSQNNKICLDCFASGAEYGNHSSAHSYTIEHCCVKPVRFSAWSRNEEYTLIEFIERHGFGNWKDICQSLGIKNNFLRNYFDDILWKSFGVNRLSYSPVSIPYLFHGKTFDPPRCPFDFMQNKFISNYHFARSDFDTPFDCSAENLIKDLNTNDDWNNEYQNVFDQLNCALIAAYNNRLRERKRRQKIVRQHGLIAPYRTRCWLSKYSKALSVKGSSDCKIRSGKFVAFMQLLDGNGFDRLVESLQIEYDLRKFILKLYELREKGITTCYGGKIFHNLRSYTLVGMQNKQPFDWKRITTDFSNSSKDSKQILKRYVEMEQGPKRRKSTPLNITGLTNYEKLNKEEQELCSTIRIVPNAYISYKLLLETENNKFGYLRLADARKLIKIDVNKTRVLYDFLVEHGFINKSVN